jgi:DNA-binding transcriptional regulator YhcF (GntR family)
LKAGENKMKQSTSKKISVIGTEQYVNCATGNVEDFNVISQHEQDFNFEKFWISQIMFAIDEFGSKKLDLLMHLLKTRDKGNNTVIKTVRELAGETGISKETVSATLQILEKNGIIKRKIGVIFISPDVIFRGSHNKRMNVLIQYRAVSQNEQDEQEETKPKQLNSAPASDVASIPGFALKNKKEN